MSGVFDNKITWSQLLIFADRHRAVLTCETKTGFKTFKTLRKVQFY